MKTSFSMITLLVGLTACGVPYAVVKQAEPNPFFAPAEFYVEPISIEGLYVGNLTAAQYAARKSAASQESFRQDLADMAALFSSKLRRNSKAAFSFTTQPVPDGFIIRPRLAQWEPGIWFLTDARAEMTIQVFAPTGELLDEVDLHATESVNAIMPTSGDRMRSSGADLAQQLVRYLSDRFAQRKMPAHVEPRE